MTHLTQHLSCGNQTMVKPWHSLKDIRHQQVEKHKLGGGKGYRCRGCDIKIFPHEVHKLRRDPSSRGQVLVTRDLVPVSFVSYEIREEAETIFWRRESYQCQPLQTLLFAAYGIPSCVGGEEEGVPDHSSSAVGVVRVDEDSGSRTARPFNLLARKIS